MKPTISPVGDRAISIDFGQVIDPKINRHIRQTIERIKELQLEGIIELVPTYCALLVEYDAMPILPIVRWCFTTPARMSILKSAQLSAPIA